MLAVMTTVASARTSRIGPADRHRLDDLIGFVRGHDTRTAFDAVLPPEVPAEIRDLLVRHCVFDHAATLVFAAPEAVTAAMATAGLVSRHVVPSTVVRDRLTERSGLTRTDLDVWIVRAHWAREPSKAVEVFVVADDVATNSPGLADAERAANHEAHLSFRTIGSDSTGIADLMALLRGFADMAHDGGGYDPHADVTTCYLRRPGRIPGVDWPVRVGLTSDGRHQGLLDAMSLARHDC